MSNLRALPGALVARIWLGCNSFPIAAFPFLGPLGKSPCVFMLPDTILSAKMGSLESLLLPAWIRGGWLVLALTKYSDFQIEIVGIFENCSFILQNELGMLHIPSFFSKSEGGREKRVR